MIDVSVFHLVEEVLTLLWAICFTICLTVWCCCKRRCDASVRVAKLYNKVEDDSTSTYREPYWHEKL